MTERFRCSSHAPIRLTAALLATVTAIVSAIILVATPAPASAVADGDWLGIVNTYRAMSGLAPVSANTTWSAQAQDHSCYMLHNGITHDEQPGLPGYTSGGDLAGNSGNVAVSSSASATARSHIDLWMTGPFHAIGVLRHNLTSSGFGLCNSSSSSTQWRSGGTLDVIRGIDSSRPRPNTPIVFPGNGATVPLSSFVTEYPNPLTMCGWTGTAGLPLIAMMPNKVSSASATITGPNGPIPTCSLHAGNTASNATANAILGGDNAIVVMPRTVLSNGTYNVHVTSNGGTASWSFTVDTSAPLSATPPKAPPAIALPDTKPTASPVNFHPVEQYRLVDSRRSQGTKRLHAGQVVKFRVADTDVAAVSANFVAARAAAPGHLTVFDCSKKVPTVSTLGYVPGRTVANQAIVPLSKGSFCVYAHAAVDLVIDVYGFYEAGGANAEFRPINPNRVYDSRRLANGRLQAGVEREIRVAGVNGGAPIGADAVALNVTAADADAAGHLQVYRCGSTQALETSTINYAAHEARPNTVVVAAEASGRVCVKSIAPVDVVIDVTGYFAPGAGYEFTPLRSIRIFDSRRTDTRLNESTSGGRLRGGQVVRLQVAGERGVPATARAASVNLTATQSSGPVYLTAYSCGVRPNTSNLNVMPGETGANGAMVKLSPAGELCIYAFRDVHLIVDINGIWS